MIRKNVQSSPRPRSIIIPTRKGDNIHTNIQVPVGKRKRLKLTHIFLFFVTLVLFCSLLAVALLHSHLGNTAPAPRGIHSSTFTSTSADKSKPKLVLHVGPRKTATTSIQQSMLYTELTKRHHNIPSPDNDKIDEMFKKDNYTIVWHGWSATEQISEQCFQKLHPDPSKDKCDYTLWNQLLAKYDDAYQNGSHVLQSEEAFSIIPRTEEVKKILQKLKEKWDVHIILVHRTLDSWIPSMFTEYRLPGVYRKTNRIWKKWDYIEPRQLTFPQWFDMMWPTLDTVEGDPLGTKEWFEEIFGSQSVHVMEMTLPDQKDVTLRFVCDTLDEISEAPNACKFFTKRKKRIGKRNQGQILPLNEDLIMMKGWHKYLSSKLHHMYPDDDNGPGIYYNMIDGKRTRMKICQIIERHQAALKFIDYMSSKNLTFEKDMPRVCMNDEMTAKLANRTYYSDKTMALSPRSYDEIYNSIKGNFKFCSVDVEKVVPMFKDWFLSDALKSSSCEEESK
mmetsp:Transcript_15058/g.18365  ORF Transcript_15058/g.18365 Transcript_15058/m.18365 type:complete len:504 (-) Transcript_15058:51-1562(-)